MNYEDAGAIQQMNAAIARAHELGPDDIFTKTAQIVRTALLAVLVIPVTIAEIPLTLIGGCAIGCTAGLLLLPLSIIWLPQLGLLLGTSWLWLKAPILRPFLLIPGVAIAVISNTYVALMPDPEKASKYTKLAITSEWPLSIMLVHPGRLFDESETVW
jgi:hypothetical protein